MKESSADDKIKMAEFLLQSIRSKSDAILSQTKHLKSFNRRLELLLACFKAYSIAESGNITGTKNIVAESVPSVKRIKTSALGDEHGKDAGDKKSPVCEISRLFLNNKTSRELAMCIYDLIKQREQITFDELVKGIKQSKYKVIDTINVLVREKVIVKSFDKGFVYRLNK